MRDGLKHPTILQMPFGGRVVALSSPASIKFDLQGVGPQVIAWEPDGKEAFQLEVRARIQSNNASDEAFPIVVWKTEISAGEAVWDEPFPTRPVGAQQDIFSVPARGMVWRTAARQFRITFAADGLNSDASALINAELQVSILPVWGDHVDTYPYADSGARLDNRTHPFPMTAREWRVFDARGLPFAPAVSPIFFAGLNSAPIIGGFAAEYADWRPIPFDAVGWVTLAGAYAAYR